MLQLGWQTYTHIHAHTSTYAHTHSPFALGLGWADYVKYQRNVEASERRLRKA